MRDPKRIPIILKRLQKIWEQNPDMRLGQLIENVFPNTPYDFISAYFIEDDKFIKQIEDFYRITKPLSKKPVYRRFGKPRSMEPKRK